MQVSLCLISHFRSPALKKLLYYFFSTNKHSKVFTSVKRLPSFGRKLLQLRISNKVTVKQCKGNCASAGVQEDIKKENILGIYEMLWKKACFRLTLGARHVVLRASETETDLFDIALELLLLKSMEQE